MLQNSQVKGEKSKVKKELLIKVKTVHFALQVIQFINNQKQNHITIVLNKQLLRSATSIGANIVEGQSASSIKEFINYYQIALKSANETKYWLYLLLQSNLVVNKDNIEGLQTNVSEISKILATIIIKLKKKLQKI